MQTMFIATWLFRQQTVLLYRPVFLLLYFIAVVLVNVNIYTLHYNYHVSIIVMYAKSLGKEATILGGVWGWFKYYPLCLVSAC